MAKVEVEVKVEYSAKRVKLRPKLSLRLSPLMQSAY